VLAGEGGLVREVEIDLMREAVVSLPSPNCSSKLPRGGEQL
jgi:hypothetical protein